MLLCTVLEPPVTVGCGEGGVGGSDGGDEYNTFKQKSSTSKKHFQTKFKTKNLPKQISQGDCFLKKPENI